MKQSRDFNPEKEETDNNEPILDNNSFNQDQSEDDLLFDPSLDDQQNTIWNIIAPYLQPLVYILNEISATGLEPVFNWFLGRAAYEAFVWLANGGSGEEANGDMQQDSWMPAVFGTLVGALVLHNLILDMRGNVSPAEDTYEVVTGTGNDKLIKDAIREQRLTNTGALLVKAKNFFDFVPISLFSFGILASADGVAFKDWGVEGIPLYILTGSASLLGTLYYKMFTDKKIVKHNIAFVQQIEKAISLLKSPSDLGNAMIAPFSSMQAFRQFLSNTCRGLEAGIMTSFNASYRGISAAFIGYSVLNIIKENAGKDYGFLVWSALGTTVYLTFFSRLLGTYEKFFNKEFDNLSPTDIKSARISPLRHMANGLITLARSAPLAALLYRNIDFGLENESLEIFAKLAVSATPAAIFGLHALVTRMENSRLEAALSVQQASAKKTLLATKKNTYNQQGTLGAGDFFDLISADKGYTNSPVVSVIAKELNLASRLVRGIGFLRFIQTLIEEFLHNDLQINTGLDFGGVLSLGLFIAFPILENDFNFFQQGIEDNIAAHRTRLFIQFSRTDYQGHRLLNAGFWKDLFYSSKHQLDSSVLEEIYKDVVAEKQPLLNSLNV